MNNTNLPTELAKRLRTTHWLEPWEPLKIDNQNSTLPFEVELARELHSSHVLFPHRKSARSIANRLDRDDVLFWVPNADRKFAIVHLTWRVETDSNWPATRFLEDFSEFIDQVMTLDHQEWA